MTITGNYEVLHEPGHAPVKSWTRGVPFADNAKRQVLNMAQMPFIHKWVAIMPDVHLGKGATIGSVIPTIGAVIPAAVGVDLGCGMMAAKTTLSAADLPDSLELMRSAIEKAVPHGITFGGRDKGSWGDPPADVLEKWLLLSAGFQRLCDKHPFLKNSNNLKQLGTLGTGNHFIEVCLDEDQAVWVMLHSGSRGVGNKIGTHFIEQAKKEMERWFIHLPDKDLAYIPEGSQHFRDYVEAVAWAQDFAQANREVMMARTLQAIREVLPKAFSADVEAVNCHHNYISREHHYDKDVWVTRKGAVSARAGEMGIIPGSMGAKSYIVRGLGNEESFCSCSHGAGRVMSRTEAKRRVSMEEHKRAVAGVECRTDDSVIDETPSAYKPIEKVMAAQSDLVEIVHTLKQVLCVKG
ncbi:MAG: RtcB family protein [Gammaproteobacteria bacterium]|nr:RtcB family protein [Gammaproteobacteria bacterium]MBU1725738.1 RtcB family protein [Gammaproteobacteria bacterium]MBU2003910.1 RtcB family protein [Gammaproteobacteria bacterium]